METDTKDLTNENLKKELNTVGMSKSASILFGCRKRRQESKSEVITKCG